jgi:SAM-dependent methyltransferase
MATEGVRDRVGAEGAPSRTFRPEKSGLAGARKAYRDLFLISFVVLFLELACIRWFGGFVTYLTYFTNIILLASFLGVSVGCMIAGRRLEMVKAVLPLTLVAVGLGYATHLLTTSGSVAVDVGNQASPQQVYFGAENAPLAFSGAVVPIEAIAGAFFALVALVFVGLGQALGRAFNAAPDRVVAYTVNVLGSLAGIAAFGLASYGRTSPFLWFTVAGAVLLYVTRPWATWQVGALLALLYLVAQTAFGVSGNYSVLWSPYYKVQFAPGQRVISANHIGHQVMVPVGDEGPAYALPHLLRRDSGGTPFEDVLVIGAGSGNDVQAALSHGARHVDAVEIDPVLYRIGRDHHPDHPYSDPRVSVHLDDGRNFARRDSRTYDLIVYALVDSLVLHSGYSSLRLESYLFTEEALRDVKARLKPGGVFVMYNYYRQGWVVGRLAKMAERTFGTRPFAISMPDLDRITPETDRPGFTMLMVGAPGSEAVDRIRSTLATKQSFWLNPAPRLNATVNGFGPRPPALAGTSPRDWIRIGPCEVETDRIDRVPTDDWPFLYLRHRAIPALNLRGMAVVAAISLAVLLAFAPSRRFRPDGRMFFLGAGFMLLETKGVVQLALLFGSTWLVNSVVFAAVLAMILLANLFVLGVRPRRLGPYYGMLAMALLVNAFLPVNTFLALSATTRAVASCLLVFAPVFFAGVIFATAFQESPRPDLALGSNIAGAVLGGLCENLSLVLGFNHLLLVALGFYLLSASRRPAPRVATLPATV